LDANGLLRLVNRKYGVSQERLGHFIGVIDAREVNKRINGRKPGRVESLRRWKAIADALNMPDHARGLIGLAPAVSTGDRPERVLLMPGGAAAEGSGAATAGPVGDPGGAGGHERSAGPDHAVGAAAAGLDVGGLVRATAGESAAVIRMHPGSAVTAEQLDSDVRDLAVAYLDSPPGPMLAEADSLRGAIVRLLGGDRGLSGGDRRDLLVAAGLASGIMAYAALDLGYGREGNTHARAAYVFGELAGDNGMRAWARGTQSLITRFLGDFRRAYRAAQAGGVYATTGAAAVRLACGEAQCLAQLGDSAEAHKALDRAAAERDRASSADTAAGIFAFPLAKQFYYAGSSLIWLDGKRDAVRATSESCEAIKLFESSTPGERSHSDESLARIYLATARLQLGDLNGAVQAYRRVLNLPAERRISWIVRRLDRLYDMLGQRRYEKSPLAREARDEIMTAIHAASVPAK